MMNVRPKGTTPLAIKNAVFNKLLTQSVSRAAEFERLCRQSVDLMAKNTSNKKSRDLAVVQVCHLAKTYGVRVDLE